MNKDKLYVTALTENEFKRYPRQFTVKDIGCEGQIKIRNSTVLIVGLGGLGSPVLMYLASCGLKKIGVVDHDRVEIHNLQRQIIHSEEFIGKFKTESAFEYIKHHNSSMLLEEFNIKIDQNNIETIAKDYEYILDCTDDIETRYILSDYCSKHNKNMILGSVLKFSGQVFVLPKGSPCYRCLFKDKKSVNESCAMSGVLGPACGIIGSIMAMELIKMIIKPLETYMLVYDAMEPCCQKIALRVRDEDCNSSHSSIIDAPKKVTEEPITTSPKKITWSTYLNNRDDYILVDVSPKNFYDIITISGAVSMPYNELKFSEMKFDKKLAVMCRKGITSLKAESFFREKNIEAYSIIGGLESFKSEIDQDYPF